MNDEYSFTIKDDDGNEVRCDVISIIRDDKSGEVYVLYTDYSMNDKNQFSTYLSLLLEENGHYLLKSVDSKEKYEYLIKNAKDLYGKTIEELRQQISD